MEALREKSYFLTAYLEYLILHYYPRDGSDNPYMDIITPQDPSQRGAQLSIQFSLPINNVYRELCKRGCVVSLMLTEKL
jgi:kynureninase